VTDFQFPQKQQGRGFAILSPYLIPREMQRKRVNLGDGFILEAIERTLGPFAANAIFTSRRAPTGAEVDHFNRSRAIILGGANQLSDRFRPWPDLTAKAIKSGNLTFIPMGVGMNGEPPQNRGFHPETLEVLRAIHDRIEYSSWRCPRTVQLLEDALPELSGRFLMTGCPVLYDYPILNERPVHDREDSIAVTITERGEFFDREAATLRQVARLFPNSTKYLVLHQDFRKLRGGIGPWVRAMLPPSVFGNVGKLHSLACSLGFVIVAPKSAKDAIAFYSDVDIHAGSRLHAHLLFLSRAKKSFLTYVDDRCMGFSDFLGFPVADPADLESLLDFDFTIVHKNAVVAHATMQKFVSSLEQLE
jgi:hypothetical protein